MWLIPKMDRSLHSFSSLVFYETFFLDETTPISNQGQGQVYKEQDSNYRKEEQKALETQRYQKSYNVAPFKEQHCPWPFYLCRDADARLWHQEGTLGRNIKGSLPITRMPSIAIY